MTIHVIKFKIKLFAHIDNTKIYCAACWQELNKNELHVEVFYVKH